MTDYVKAGILYVEGNGEIPDYALDALGTRPWAGQNFQNIWIGDGITEIGSNAFASFSSVINVRIPSTAFIKDATSFGGISSKAAIRISGYNVAVKMIGKIIYLPKTALHTEQRTLEISTESTTDLEYLLDITVQQQPFTMLYKQKRILSRQLT